MITFKQLYDGLVSGEIQIDENGHNPFYGWGSQDFLESMGKKIDYWDNKSSLSKQGIKWSDHIITERINRDKHISCLETDSPCARCGKRFVWFYNHDEKKIVCVVGELNSEGQMKDWFYEYDESRCEEEFNNPQSFDFEVKDEIIFANFFRDHMDKLDEEEKNRKYNYYSLNNRSGRKHVCEFHAKDNIGYQQIGNTSVDIYLSKDKTEILVIEENYVYDENDNKEYSADDIIPKLGYKFYGNVSLSMWRYMFGNKCDVKDPVGDIVELKPKKGKYVVHNYFNTSEHYTHKIDRFPIASRIKLKS